MASYILSTADVQAAVLGGALLGGGGGGSLTQGSTMGELALAVGTPQLLSLDELADDDLLAVVALVGAPSAREQYLKPVHYIRAIELLQARLGRKLAGITTNENGAGTTVNGWFQAAMLGLPVIDAPSNGRAHPTGVMGSMGLQQDASYVSIQAAAGGRADKYIETVVSGSLTTCASLIRKASVEAGGLVAVARNPVTVRYAREHAACGAIGQALELGRLMLKQQTKGGDAVARAAMEFLGGKIICQGTVENVTLNMQGGFDVGTVEIKDYALTFWNEYMTLEQGGERLGTFPDLIMTLQRATGIPIPTAELQQGEEIILVHVPRQRLLLGAGMRDPQLFKPIEQVIGKPVLSYIFA
ncbi:DUF917 family protein [Ktedonosporobacter rubrisoli]|uniref:DUF917 family protein n=1 Tax=Ktedonosporobacter rubrisoli TaxID=2509675 RepID=A0A4P6JYK7_KTERU|nr:DUF917 family protein [Ktedonosporobacter rubrisoli]QBD80817.1 DUF917 family protein [Ktedonosporobacter rubrisoli]